MKKFLLLFVPVLGMYACGDNGGDNTPDFDRAALLTHYTNHFILPAYQQLWTGVDALHTAVLALEADPTPAHLTAAQDAWLAAYLAWQPASGYNFGPAAAEGLSKSLAEEIATFPVATDKVENYVAAGDLSFNNFDRDSRGLLAAEYLLFGPDAASQLASTPQRRAYLAAVTAQVRSRVLAVRQAWDGPYSLAFVANTGVDVGSSVSQFYNEFVKGFEGLKNFKVGLPLGLRAGQSAPEPTRVEAYYSGRSLELVRAHFRSVVEIWSGDPSGGVSGPGLEEYLLSVVGGGELVAGTRTQIAAVEQALATLDYSTPFQDQIATDPTRFDNLHTELQKMTRFFKSDLSSLLGISITFASGDGD